MDQQTEQKQPTQFIPPQKRYTIELLVGIFAILGVGSFAYLAINIAQLRLSDSGYYKIQAKFGSISGLKPGAPVEIAGVAIGEVGKIELDPATSTEAILTLNILDGIKLLDDDVAAIRTKGIIGDRYVKISRGGSEISIPPGGRLSETESVVDIEDIIGKIVHSLTGEKDEDKTKQDPGKTEPAAADTKEK